MSQAGRKLADEPLHLGLNATSTPKTKITDMSWYEQYSRDTASDGNEGRLVSLHEFTSSWDSWEMHPVGEEAVICTKGTITLLQDVAGDETNVTTTVLHEGEYAVNPKGTWHTANVVEPCTVLFITPGVGTQHKPR
jgi:Cupin domain